MAEVLMEFEHPVAGPDGTLYRAQACGAETNDGTDRWEGWIEFVPAEGGETLRSRRETTQPNRTDTAYWATGLSPVYLRGTLERTLSPAPATPVARVGEAVFEEPARTGTAPLSEPSTPSVLNPFSVYRKGETHLRRQLGALSAWHLANIVRAHGLSDLKAATLDALPHQDLVDLIVTAVRLRAAE